MSTPLVTVGIPFFNNENHLLDAIRSIFAQTYSNWELILVDDGSTDNSLEIAKSIDDSRVRVVSDGANRKLPSRLNQIVSLARGEYIARMDADDLSHPQRFAKELDFLNDHKDIDVVGTCMYILGPAGQPESKIVVPTKHELITRNKFKRVSMAHATVMARAKWFRRWPYDEKYPRTQDWRLWLCSMSNTVFDNIPEPLYLCNAFTSFSLSKCAKSKHSAAKTVLEYASAEAGWLRAGYYAGRLYAQIAVYAALNLFGSAHFLVRRRYRPLTSQEVQQANAAMELIKKTEVPIRTMK